MKTIAKFTEPVKKLDLELIYLNLNEVHIPPFQRDISDSLRKHLEIAIESLGFLTPIVVTQVDGKFYVIDGQHRLEAMKSIGAREIIAISVPSELYHHILSFNTEKPPTIREKSKQAYRLYMDIFKENPNVKEDDLFAHFKDPIYVTFGFALEEIDGKFPAGFYDNFVSKIDSFLPMPLTEAVEERRRRARALVDLNSVVASKYSEFGWDNALMKGEIVRKAVQKAFGVRVRVIEEDFYSAVELVKKACEELTPEDFE